MSSGVMDSRFRTNCSNLAAKKSPALESRPLQLRPAIGVLGLAVDVDGFLRFCWLAGMIRLGVAREGAAADIGAVVARSVRDRLTDVDVLTRELWRLRK